MFNVKVLRIPIQANEIELNPATLSLSYVWNLERGAWIFRNLRFDHILPLGSHRTVLIFGLNFGPTSFFVKKANKHLMTPVPFTAVHTDFTEQHGRKLSVRRGNPLGVLWVICWCGTWAVKHPGALQEHRVTVTLSGFTVASASLTAPLCLWDDCMSKRSQRRRRYNCICSDTWLDLFDSYFTSVHLRSFIFSYFLQRFPSDSYFILSYVLC